jgi:glycosyltransferase involved in cell wall biosynthesis
MKVLFLITRAELGGAQTHVVDLLRGLRSEMDLEVGTGERGYLTETAGQLGIPCHIVPDLVQPMRPWQDLRALRNCVRLIRGVRPDIVHTHTSKAGVIGRLAARLAGVPAIFTAHTWCFAEGTSWKWKAIGIPLERLAARCSARILTVSDSNRELALRHRIAGAAKFATVHNGIEDSPRRLGMEEPLPTGHGSEWRTAAAPRIIMVARFSPQKAQALLLDAVRDIEAPFELLFVGDGPDRSALEQRAAEMGLQHRVKFLGQRLDIPELLASSDIFALATNWEGFPIGILEAMRAGLPVVASNVNGVGEAVSDGVTGYLVPAADSNAFRNRLVQLLTDVNLRRNMGAAGRLRFEKEFTADVMLRKTASIYRELVREAPQLEFETSKRLERFP